MLAARHDDDDDDDSWFEFRIFPLLDHFAEPRQNNPVYPATVREKIRGIHAFFKANSRFHFFTMINVMLRAFQRL